MASLAQRRATIYMTPNEQSLSSLKHTLGMAMKTLFKRNLEIA